MFEQASDKSFNASNKSSTEFAVSETLSNKPIAKRLANTIGGWVGEEQKIDHTVVVHSMTKPKGSSNLLGLGKGEKTSKDSKEKGSKNENKVGNKAKSGVSNGRESVGGNISGDKKIAKKEVKISKTVATSPSRP